MDAVALPGFANTPRRAPPDQRECGVHSDITNNPSIQNTLQKVRKPFSVARNSTSYLAEYVVHKSSHRDNHPLINTVHCKYPRPRRNQVSTFRYEIRTLISISLL